jgi:hypothetical protein
MPGGGSPTIWAEPGTDSPGNRSPPNPPPTDEAPRRGPQGLPGLPCPRPGWGEPTARPAICLDARAGRVPPPAPGPFRSRSSPRIRQARCRLIRVRWTRASRRVAPHRLWLRSGLADTSCHSGTKGPVDSRPLPVAPLHVGSPWRSAAELCGASSLGFDMARSRHNPSRTGHCAHRLGLARRTHRTQPSPCSHAAGFRGSGEVARKKVARADA